MGVLLDAGCVNLSLKAINDERVASVGVTTTCRYMLILTFLPSRYSHQSYRPVPAVLLDMWRAEGVSVLYRGLMPTLLRDVPFSAIYIACYERGKTQLQTSLGEGYATKLTAAFGAGVIATLSTQVQDVFKTDVQLAATGTPSPTWRQTLRRHVEPGAGRAALWASIVVRLGRKVGMTAVTWTLYETVLADAVSTNARAS
jgi:hypothetical protein